MWLSRETNEIGILGRWRRIKSARNIDSSRQFSDDESDIDLVNLDDSTLIIDGLPERDISHNDKIAIKAATETHDGFPASPHWGARFTSQLEIEIQNPLLLHDDNKADLPQTQIGLTTKKRLRTMRFDLFCAASPHADKVRRVQDHGAALFGGQGACVDENDIVATWLKDVNDDSKGLLWV
ncbi:hypothetical protein AMAG_02882 [Allomyces macrogynus ATCC 38327]|uniref:Uncharacterized protein n=1 Tax=Allomyces macrogynus (strain ATCC 38327) TaxID=578462 RepID=A0A0L0S405_ALLM3|nr:hypothetical protein AMAG_02882 [Allomyces macrogynus ATCC 38327]|eukprot:KNE57131.1 hypothetical protein AMAG_02882 [Allomyces macrogynus ATCC 38327]